MPIHNLQSSFVGGEFSPDLQARSDLQKYPTGLKRCRNFIPRPGGMIRNRPGTRFVALAKSSVLSDDVNLVDFQFSDDQTYVIEFMAGSVSSIRFYTNDGQLLCVNNDGAFAVETFPLGRYYQIGDIVTYGGLLYKCVIANTGNSGSSPKIPGVDPNWEVVTLTTPYEISHPYTSDELKTLRFAQSGDFIFIAHKNHPPMVLKRLGLSHWHLAAITSEVAQPYGSPHLNFAVDGVTPMLLTNGPFMLQNVDTNITLTSNVTIGSGNLVASRALFNAGHVGSLFQLIHNMPSASNAGSIIADNTIRYVGALGCGSKWSFYCTGDSFFGAITIQVQDITGTWKDIQTFVSLANTIAATPIINTFGTVDFITAVRIQYRVGAQSTNFAVNLVSDGYTQYGIFQVQSFTDSKNVAGIAFPAIGQTTATSAWAECAWSQYRGFPRAVEFFQDRLTFASTDFQPNGVWTSKTSSYYDFGISYPSLLDTDAININVPNRKVNAIKSLVALDSLIGLTSSGEVNIGANGGALTPSTVSAKTTSSRGASDLNPLLIGDRIVHQQSAGSAIRDLGFDLQNNGYTGEDLTLFCKHFIESHELVDSAYQQEPDSIAWFVRDDGVLLSMTYLKVEQVLSWASHDLGMNGFFESVCTIKQSGYNELWVSCYLSNGKRLICRLDSPYQSKVQYSDGRPASFSPFVDVRKQFYVDCGLTVDNPKTALSLSQVGPNLRVNIVAHGFSNGESINCSDGIVPVDSFGVAIGLPALEGNFTIGNVTADTFDLMGVDGSEFNLTLAYNFRLRVTSISGLDHLEGLTVSILADGNVVDPRVVTSGAINLPFPASIVQVGLEIVSELTTLNCDLVLKDGTMQDRKTKITQVMINFINSRGGSAGSDPAFLDPIITADPNLEIGKPQPLFSDKWVQPLNSQYERGSSVTVRQSDPLPLNIITIVPIFSVGGI